MTEQRARLIGKIVGIGRVQIANGDQLDQMPDASLEFSQSSEMATAHTTAANNGETQWLHLFNLKERRAT